jgi:hypothetical protein
MLASGRRVPHASAVVSHDYDNAVAASDEVAGRRHAHTHQAHEFCRGFAGQNTQLSNAFAAMTETKKHHNNLVLRGSTFRETHAISL